jgi:hypothetical protein
LIQKNGDDGGIELGSGSASQDLQGLFRGERLSLLAAGY